MSEQENLLDNAENETGPASAGARNVLGMPETDSDRDRRIAWWREARIGLFIHWGLYSVPAGIWKGREVVGSYAEHVMLRAQIPVKEYETIASGFNPDKFDADAWVAAAKQAGLQYLVFTAKHHDGFAMYDSQVSDYNIVSASPFGRDPVAELAEACRKHDVKLCLYYSHSMDWHHPDSQGNTWDYPGNIGAYDEVESWIGDEDKRSRYERYLEQAAMPQIRELLIKYGPIGVLWFDCGHKLTEEQGRRFVELVRSVQPDCLVNRRVWREPFGDYGNTSDNQPHVRAPRPDWESIATLNDSWGYKKNDRNWKSPRQVLHQLLDVVSMNGNFLINVGPTGEGEFDPVSLDILRRLGGWMQTNGESIYGTVKSPIGKPPWGRCTAKGDRLYLHVTDWPSNGKLIVPGLRNRIRNVYALAEPRRSLPFARLSEEDFVIELPAEPFDPLASVVVADIEGTPDANPVRLLFPDQYPNVFGAFDGEIAGKALQYDTGKINRDNLVNWSEPGDEVRWSFRAGSPGVYRLQASYGVDAASSGGTFTVTVGERQTTAVTVDTGGWHSFRTEDLGTVDIPASGHYRITVRADEIPGEALMNLRDIRLVGEAQSQ